MINYTDKSKKFGDNMIKGCIAEAIAEQMFICMGYKIYRFGVENTIPG